MLAHDRLFNVFFLKLIMISGGEFANASFFL
jgi:hypothetical protein